MARFVHDDTYWPAPRSFISYYFGSRGRSTPETCRRHIVASVERLTGASDAWGHDLAACVREAALTTPLVFCIDAVDELTAQDPHLLSDSLQLPHTLPSNIHFLISVRSNIPFRPFSYSPVKYIDLESNGPGHDHVENNRNDARLYLNNWRSLALRSTSTARDRLSTLEDANPDWINDYLDKSASNFMYLRYLVEDLWCGRSPSDTNSLEEYYYHNWSSIYPTLDRGALLVLCAMCEISPAKALDLSRILSLELPQVAAALRHIGQFLEFSNEASLAEREYRFYHESFRDFLRKQDAVEAVRLQFLERNATAFHNLDDDI